MLEKGSGYLTLLPAVQQGEILLGGESFDRLAGGGVHVAGDMWFLPLIL